MTLLQEGLLTSLTIILLFSTRGTPLPQMFERSNSDISSFPSDVVGSDYLFNSPDQTPSTTGMTASDPETLALDGSSAAPVVHIAAAVKGSNSCPAPLKQNPSSQELPVQPDLNSLPLPSNADQQRPIPDLPPIPRCPGKQISLCCSGRLQDLGYVLDCIKRKFSSVPEPLLASSPNRVCKEKVRWGGG